MIAIEGLAALRARMERLEVEAAARRGLLAAGEHVAESTRQLLSTLPGGPHESPWLRSGALRASIGVTQTDNATIVVSTSDVAVHQELGTARIPPRPFLAPTAAAEADVAARTVADALATELHQGTHTA